MSKQIRYGYMSMVLVCIVCLMMFSCRKNSIEPRQIYISGQANESVSYLKLGKDTIHIAKGVFSDTLIREESQYNYIQLDTWKWPKIIYLNTEEPDVELDFMDETSEIGTNGDRVNQYLLNKDSILLPYTARWNMKDSVFRKAWSIEFPENMSRIDSYFEQSNVSSSIIEELKQMELMLRGHLTANFISFQERKGRDISRDIYDFVEDIDLNNDRLSFHQNNRNFQYYYYLDKVPEEVPDSIYPFAAIDTVEKYVHIDDIKKMIVGLVVKAGLYDETVNHDALFDVYERHIGALSNDDQIVQLYDQIQRLKPGNPAAEIGELQNHLGSNRTIESYRGENILITAWGTWCPYCKEELPHLKKLIDRYSDKFTSVAISLDTDVEVWKKFIDENDWSGHHLIDSERYSTFRSNYLISGTNVYYLIDKNQIIVGAHLKPSNPQLEELIKHLD